MGNVVGELLTTKEKQREQPSRRKIVGAGVGSWIGTRIIGSSLGYWEAVWKEGERIACVAESDPERGKVAVHDVPLR